VLPEIGRIASLRRKEPRGERGDVLLRKLGRASSEPPGSVKRPLARRPVASFQSHVLVRAETVDEGRRKQKERVAMAPWEILKALSQGHERWPGDALEAASSQRSKVSSLLLERLAQAVAKPILMRFPKTPSPLTYGVFLLADWRENPAYRPFARLMRFPWVAHDNLLGEPAIEEPGHRITASLFDGDPQFVFDIILDVGADPSVRFSQRHALTLIELEGNLDRTVAADFARQAFGKLSPDEEKLLIWVGWEKLISRPALAGLAPLLRKAHDADLLVESTHEEFQHDLEYVLAHPDALCRPGDELEALASVRELKPWVEL
jgi:hypothetical protein